MGLIFGWLLLVWLFVFVAYWLGRYYLSKHWRRGKAAPVAVPIAHSDRLIALPAYQSAMRRYQLLLRAAMLGLSLTVVAGVILTARPAKVSYVTPLQQKRDIMLCLDVSGSMLEVDTILVHRFSSLVNSFSGQRFGLSVFNSSSIVVVPLSDDYQLINQQLTQAATALQVQKGQAFTDLTSGTLADFSNGTSLVGDGLTSCINNLGSNPQQRSQSVILATDNEVNGKSLISLSQAAGLAAHQNIRVYAIDPAATDLSHLADHKALQTAAESTGGGYYPLNNTDTVTDIINAISKQESEYAGTAPSVSKVDWPAPLDALLVIVGVSSMALLWRIKL